MPSKVKLTQESQLRASKRKGERRKLRRAEPHQQKLAARNSSQALQDLVKCEIVVDGLRSWKGAFPGTVEVYPSLEKYFGTIRPTWLDYLRISSDMHGISHELSVISELMTRGYRLEELEVEFMNEENAAWGKGVWYKDHPSYDAPSEEAKKLFPKATRLAFAHLYSMFKTEHAGDQMFCMFSGSMMSSEFTGQPAFVLLHKTLIFHRARLSPPAVELKKAA